MGFWRTLLGGGVLGLAIWCTAWGAGPKPTGPTPPLWGYGVKGCDEYASVSFKHQEGSGEGAGEYQRYQDWLTGFISGLNLATGSDVLAGIGIDAAMRRIGLYCEEHRKQDFFAGTTDLVKSLSQWK